MRRFTELYERLDATTRTTEKVAALEAYFADAPPADAAWALWYLAGRRVKRTVSTTLLRAWAAEVSELPPWLVDECYDAVGDLAETIALLLPDPDEPVDVALHELMERRLLPLRELDEADRRELVLRAWGELDRRQRFVWHKLITGGFRVGVARTLVARALGNVAGVSQAAMAQRLMGELRPTAADYAALLSDEGPADAPSRPYPFFLASPLENDPASLGDVAAWQVEWKWDGIRGQLIRRQGTTAIWSRGEELVTDRFPELVLAAERLPDGTVLDGEVLAWRDDAPLPFAVLQTRIGRRRPSARALERAPVVFVAYDLLEAAGIDVRDRPLDERRASLDALLRGGDGDGGVTPDVALRPSPLVEAASWSALAERREQSRERGVEGLMLKRRDSPYGTGRVRGDWWKWKVDPYTIDAVLISAQRGHGRRASLYTDYTFGVWRDDELVPVAKAYSGLTDDEIAEVDAFVRRHVTGRYGPVRTVEPRLVFELAFEGIRASPRHKSGVALRFPRMARWRRDKPPDEADTLAAVKTLLPGGARG